MSDPFSTPNLVDFGRLDKVSSLYTWLNAWLPTNFCNMPGYVRSPSVWCYLMVITSLIYFFSETKKRMKKASKNPSAGNIIKQIIRSIMTLWTVGLVYIFCINCSAWRGFFISSFLTMFFGFLDNFV
jgi:hypothetical protein